MTKGNEMLKELFDAICANAAQAVKPHVSRAECDPRHMMVAYNGKLESLSIPPPIRDHVVTSLDSLATAVELWDSGNTVVYYGVEEIVAVLDDEDRRDVVTMPLTLSQAWQYVAALPGKRFEQKEFVRLLRLNLSGVAPAALLPLVRKIDVSSGSLTTSDLSPGRERGTKEFRQELATQSELPDRVQLMCSIHATPGVRAERAIACAFEFDLSSLTFRLEPLPDELQAATEAALFDLGETLSDRLPKGVTVLAGKP